MFVKRSHKFLLFFAIASCQMTFAPRLGAADDTVTIDSGTLKGERSGSVVSFKGIPYAAPPVGDLRWRNPRPMKPWSGTRDARDFGASCMPLPFLKGHIRACGKIARLISNCNWFAIRTNARLALRTAMPRVGNR